jgi:hypothetical protein
MAGRSFCCETWRLRYLSAISRIRRSPVPRREKENGWISLQLKVSRADLDGTFGASAPGGGGGIIWGCREDICIAREHPTTHPTHRNPIIGRPVAEVRMLDFAHGREGWEKR